MAMEFDNETMMMAVNRAFLVFFYQQIADTHTFHYAMHGFRMSCVYVYTATVHAK